MAPTLSRCSTNQIVFNFKDNFGTGGVEIKLPQICIHIRHITSHDQSSFPCVHLNKFQTVMLSGFMTHQNIQ